jgi:hypothetical protein
MSTRIGVSSQTPTESQWSTQGRTLGNPECTPGYYNNEGKELDFKDRHNVGYPKGSAAFFKMMNKWRARNTFESLTFH